MANFKTIWKMVAVVCVVLWPPLAGADDKTWKMHTEAGEEAYRQGNLTEAEKEFREARKETDALAFPDQRQAVSLENLARFWLIAVGRPVARAPPHRSRRAVFPHRALQQSSLPHKVQLAETASLIRGRGRIRGRGSWKCCSSARKLAQL